jgi:hypothetical protein
MIGRDCNLGSYMVFESCIGKMIFIPTRKCSGRSGRYHEIQKKKTSSPFVKMSTLFEVKTMAPSEVKGSM